MSSSSSSVAATVTALLALTTPFVAPPGCPSFTTASVDTSSIDGVAAVLVADDPSCLPNGWADVVPESRMNFNPAVCPKGWVYHSIAGGDATDKFTALCCDSGYDYLFFKHRELVPERMTNYCGRWTSRLNLDSGSDSATITGADAASSTLLVHNAWEITWFASDIPNLTPQPPSITNRMLVPTWTPGEFIPDGKYDRSSPSGDNRNNFLPQEAQWFLIIGMPIIGALLIGSCIFCCVRSSKKKKRARSATVADATAAAGGVLDAK
ncbi:hypothetical protein QBC40DRAFT_291131 [Triangularia verruculosa]|uniref:Uncharacterized protein n=1 Tax=Triangularia verruculosa TaxID=2587418 RepID=A0AAN7AP37_9PEZI|nr:hypothetical protein QBC40DRAFT_291131 [Triangularia verruculosa]